VQNLFEVSRGLPLDQTLALINVGASLSSLNIIANGVSAFTREIANGGNAITEEIQKQLGVAYDQAEAYKCGGGDQHGGPGIIPEQAARVIESVTDSIAGEIQRSLDFFLATTGEGEIGRIFLTGGSANLGPLSQAIQRRSRVAVEVWMPTERIIVDGAHVNQEQLAARGAQLSVALGLGLRKDREARA
jgi:type IV pilus assembly protein PilM